MLRYLGANTLSQWLIFQFSTFALLEICEKHALDTATKSQPKIHKNNTIRQL